MAAFFALLAGLAIGCFAGMFIVGIMIGSIKIFRKYIMELCIEAENEDF